MDIFSRKIRQFNRVKLAAYIMSWLLHLVSSLLAALLVGALAQVLHQPSPLVHTLVFAFIFLLTLACCRRRERNIDRTALLLTLDHDHATTSPAPYALRHDNSSAWRSPLQRWRATIMHRELQRLYRDLARVALLLLLCGAVTWAGGLSVAQLLPAYRHFASLLQTEATLTVLPARQRHFQLQADSPPQIELAANELALIELTAPALTSNPNLQLMHAGQVWQEVQLRPLPAAENRYTVTLSIGRSSTLHIDALASGAALASIKVSSQGTPQLTLAAQTTIKNPHPDNETLSLQIEASAATPLASVKLLITTREGTFEELVNTIIATHHKYNGTYSFLPEPYVESDLAELELVAAATDRRGMTGYSAPLRINAISAWGRYRSTLEKFREVKTMLDEKLTQAPSTPSMTNINTAMRAALAQAQTSPFFDAIDRLTMTRLMAELEVIKDIESKHELVSVLEKLNSFLIEHEIINDRERDRDFFTAARHLSWMLERGDKQIEKYVQRLDKFLTARQQRWQERLRTLPQAQQPSRWQEIEKDAPFRQVLERLPALSPERARDELATLVGAYRGWLTELEAAEEQHYQQLAQQAQQVLNNAQDKLKEMQQRQTAISTYLDKAAQRETAVLQRGWTTTRMRQNTNVKAAAPLVRRLQTVSPLAAVRLQSAVRAMQATVASGEQQEFVMAESHADLAGRLLRHTRTATRQRLPSRRQRRRRISGDRYHGRSVIGGYIELQRDYRVNRKYREDILEEIRRSNLLEKHRDLLDAYLRKVIR